MSNSTIQHYDENTMNEMLSQKDIKYKSQDYYVNEDIGTTHIITVKDRHFNNIIIDIPPTMYYYYEPVEPKRINIDVVVPYDPSITEHYYIHFLVIRPVTNQLYLNVRFFRENLDKTKPFKYIRLINRKMHPTRDMDVYYMIKPKNGEVIFRAKYQGIKDIR